MKKINSTTIWPSCDPKVARAIKAFLESWPSDSTQSPQQKVFRQFKREIDPAWKGLIEHYPAMNNDVLNRAWTKYLVHRYRVGRLFNVDQDGNLGEVLLPPNIPRNLYRWRLRKNKNLNFNSLALICGKVSGGLTQKYDFLELESFIHFVARSSPAYHTATKRGLTLIASLDSLRSLVITCNKKLTPARSKQFCLFCGQLTEYAASGELSGGTASKRLSRNYCKMHRSKDRLSGAIRPEYQWARDSFEDFKRELTRLDWQSWAKPGFATAKSGNLAVDEYIRLLAVRCKLTHEQQRSISSISLEPGLRNEARMLVDQCMTDRKKEIVAHLLSGMCQSEVAKTLGVSRQTVFKGLNSIAPEKYLLGYLRVKKQKTS